MSSPIKISNISIDENCFCYLDTNIIVALILRNNSSVSQYEPELTQLLQSIIQANGNIVTGAHTFKEIYTLVRSDELRNISSSQRKQHLSNNPNILLRVTQKSDNARTAFKTNIGTIIAVNETSELLSIENRLVATANIDNQDARHIITAVSCGANYFLTADKDFAKFNTQDIKIAYPTQMSLPNCTSVPTITIPRYDKIDFEE